MFVKENKNWIESQLKNLIDDLEDEHYTDAEFFSMLDIIREKVKKEQELWKKQQEDKKHEKECEFCHTTYNILYLEDYNGKKICNNCLKSKLVCPKCKKGKLIFLKTEEKYCDTHHFHYATHRIFQCDNKKCRNIEINVIRHGNCD